MMASETRFHAFFFIFFSFFVFGIHATTMTVRNNCPYMIWPAAISSGGTGAPSLTGFGLVSKAQRNIEVPGHWIGRIWARTRCSNAGTSCATGDCGGLSCGSKSGVPPVSIAEFTLAGDGNKDFYDISLVDGFNVPIKITPQGACRTISCAAYINDKCPSGLVVFGGNGDKIACKSACLKYNDDRNCCRGAFHSANTCSPSEYSRIVKQSCPDAYSYAYDDATSTFTCPTGVNYVIAFCP